MNLHDYISASGRRLALAASIGTSPAYLWQMASGWRGRRVPAERCLAIEQATGGAVTRYELRPDIFGQAPAGETPEAAKHVA